MFIQFRCDTIIKGINFCTVNRMNISGWFNVGRSDVSHLCRGGTPILNIIRIIRNIMLSVGKMIIIMNKREALL